MRNALPLLLCLLLPPALAADAQWPYDLQHVRLRLQADPLNKSLGGDVTLTLQATGDGLRLVPLQAAQSIKVLRVAAGGQALRFTHKPPKLIIALGQRKLARGERIELQIDYRVESPRLGAYFVGPDADYPDKPHQLYTQSEPYEGPHWFPGYHEPHDKATSEAVVRVPAGFVAISNGKLVSNNGEGAWRTYHWRQQVPHSTYLIAVMVGRYRRVTIASPHRVPMAYYVEEKDAADAARSFTQTPQMMALFEKLTGQPFPFSKYDQVLVRDYKWGGMEHSSATTLSARTIHDERASLDVSSEGLVAHELAHQWYGDALTCRDFAHLWLNEGFATYFAHLWHAERFGADRMRYDLDRSKGGYTGDEDRAPQPVVRPGYKDAMSLFDGRSYGKGAWVLHMLRHVVGEEAFWQGIRLYTKRHWLQAVTTDDLRKAFDEASGQSLDWFFDQWLLRPGYPKFRVGARIAGGELLLSVEQTQQGKGVPVFRTPVDVAVRVGGKRLVRRFELRARKETLRWPLDGKPDYVRWNDGGWILCQTTFDKPLAELALQATLDADVLGRLRAVERMGAHRARLDAQEALGRVLQHDAFWGVRLAAAEQLKKAGGRLALSYLRRAAGDRHSKVRAEAARALRSFKGPEVEAELRRLLQTDRSYWVAAEALRGLAALRVKDADKLLDEYRRVPSHDQLYRRTVLQCHADRGGAPDLAAVLAATRKGQPHALREEAVGLLPRFAGKFGKQVRKSLLALLAGDRYRIRRRAAQALKDLADPATRNALDRAAHHDREQRVRKAASEALAAVDAKIKQAGDLAAQERKLQAQLDRRRLQAEQAQLDVKILELQLRRLQIERKLKGK